MRTLCLHAFKAMVALLASISAVQAADSVASFYAGKTVTIVESSGPGGGYDIYARLIAQHLGKHIPGSPNIIIQYMPGAGGRKMASQLYAVGPFDGTVIGAFEQGIALDQATGGSEIRFDARKFYWLGSPYDTVGVVMTWQTSKTKSLTDAMSYETLMGGIGPTASTDYVPPILNDLLGTKFKVITGYSSGSEIDIALEKGEVAGRVLGYDALETTSDWVANKKVNILLQYGAEKDPDLPDVPFLLDLAKSESGHNVADFISAAAAMGRPYGLPPTVPAERAKALRKAFEDTIRDPAFLADAKKAREEVRLRSGESLTKLVATQVDADQVTIADVKKAMGIKSN